MKSATTQDRNSLLKETQKEKVFLFCLQLNSTPCTPSPNLTSTKTNPIHSSSSTTPSTQLHYTLNLQSLQSFSSLHQETNQDVISILIPISLFNIYNNFVEYCVAWARLLVFGFWYFSCFFTSTPTSSSFLLLKVELRTRQKYKTRQRHPFTYFFKSCFCC